MTERVKCICFYPWPELRYCDYSLARREGVDCDRRSLTRRCSRHADAAPLCVACCVHARTARTVKRQCQSRFYCRQLPASPREGTLDVSMHLFSTGASLFLGLSSSNSQFRSLSPPLSPPKSRNCVDKGRPNLDDIVC